MAEKDHYRYGTDRKIDPSIPALRERIRDLEETLKAIANCENRRNHQCSICAGVLRSALNRGVKHD